MDSTFKPALLLMSGRVLAFAATFFIPVVLARVFDQAEFGTYKQLFLIFGTLFGIAQLGMAQSLFYFLPVAPVKGGRYVTNSILVLTAVGLVCLGSLEMAGSRIAQLLGNSALSGHVTLIGIYLLLMITSAVMEITMISRKRFLLAASAYAFSDVVRAAFFILPALLIQQLQWVLAGAVVFASARLVGTLFYVWHEFGGELSVDAELFRKQLAYALPFELAVLVEALEVNFHQYAVSYYFDAATFAIYAVGCLQIPLVDFVSEPVSNVTMVRMSQEVKDRRNEAVLAIWHDTTRKLAVIFFPLVGLLVVTARELIVFLFTENYLASVPIFMVWSTTILLPVLQTDAVLRVYAQTRFLFSLYTVRLLLVVGLIGWFLSAFGLPGAALITVFAAFVAKGLSLVRMKVLMDTRLSRILPWKDLGAIFVVAFAAGLAALMVKSQLAIPTLPLLFVTAVVYCVSYLTVSLWFNVINKEERLAVIGWLEKIANGAAKAGDFIKT